MGSKQFDWIEYIVFTMMLGFSTLIGLFFCCHRGGQKTVNEYYLGNKKMPIFPIAMSLIASSISGVTLLGVPSEIYQYGAQFVLCNIALLLVAVTTRYVFLPVFYKLQVICLYEYLELRFNSAVRKIASLLFAIAWILFIPIVIYGPAIAFNQVSGMSIHYVSPLLCAVCIFYTTFGGLKAVVWADALQGAVMLGAILTVCVMGLVKVGGIANVFAANEEGKRLNVFNMDISPTARLTFWSSSLGLWLQWCAFTATSPAAVQRFVSLPTYKQAKNSVYLLLFGTCTFNLLSCFLGLIIYATYQKCDPVGSGAVGKADQILPYFVLDVASHIKGLPGLFVAGIVCAALSTMSTGLNTLSGTIYEDFYEPVFGKASERKASNIMKVFSILIGILCVILVNLVEHMGGIIDMTSRFSGVTSGATLGIFTLGVLVPQANSKGALIGAVSSMSLMMWTMMGGVFSKQHYHHPILPISIENCSNGTTMTEEVIRLLEKKEGADVFPLYKITVFYYGAMGFMIVMVVGVIVSYMTGPSDPATINPDLISPVVRRFLPKPSKYTSVPLKDNLTEKPIEDKNHKSNNIDKVDIYTTS